MVATEAISSSIEQHKKGALNRNLNYKQKSTPLCQQIHKTFLVLIQIFQIYITELVIV